MNSQAFLIGNQEFFPKSVVAEIKSEHKKSRNFARRYIEENRELFDDDLATITSQARHQLEEMIGSACAEELATFLAAAGKVTRQADAKAIPIPSFVIVDRKPKSNEQRALRGLIKRWLYCVGGAEHVRSGLADKRAKAFSWLASTDISIGLVREIQCPACEASGQLTVFSAKKVAFACACGHWDDHELDAPPSTLFDHLPPTCRCPFCERQKKDFAQKLRQILAQSETTMADLSRKWAEALDLRYASARARAVPKQEDMRRDYLLGRDSISKSLRNVLELEPKDGDDFVECVGRIVASKSGYGPARKTANQLLTDARKYGLVYAFAKLERTDITDMAQAFAFQANLSFVVPRGRGNLRTESNASTPNPRLLDLYAMLFKSPLPELVEALQIHDSCVTINVDGYQVFLFDESNPYGTILSTCLRAAERVSYVINPYFLSGISAPGDERTVTSTSAAKLFNSTTERKAYVRLAMENACSIVVPNRLLRQVIGLEKLKDEIAPAFDPKDRSYLFGCEVDFAVYDADGRILFVEEMQRGDHHDNAEWIRKDAVKREALRLAEIPFRESF